MVAFNMEAAKNPRDASDVTEPREAGSCGAPHPSTYFRPPVPPSIRARRVVQEELLHLVVDRTGVVAHAYALEPVSNLTRRALDAVMRWQYPQSSEPVSMMVYVPFDGTGRSGEYVPGSAIWASTKPGPVEAVRLASGLAAPALSAVHRRRTTRFVYGDSHRANALFMSVQDVALLPEHAEDSDRQDDVLTGRLEFDERGLLLSADFYGPLVSETQRISMIRRLNEHPEWSAAQAANAFVAEKPKFGPDDRDAFEGLVRGLKLDRLLGHGSLSSVRFVLRAESGPLEAAARLVWTARIRTDAGRTYRLEFEPYGGRLVRLARVEPE
jgi:hypothetical protein